MHAPQAHELAYSVQTGNLAKFDPAKDTHEISHEEYLEARKNFFEESEILDEPIILGVASCSVTERDGSITPQSDVDGEPDEIEEQDGAAEDVPQNSKDAQDDHDIDAIMQGGRPVATAANVPASVRKPTGKADAKEREQEGNDLQEIEQEDEEDEEETAEQYEESEASQSSDEAKASESDANVEKGQDVASASSWKETNSGDEDAGESQDAKKGTTMDDKNYFKSISDGSKKAQAAAETISQRQTKKTSEGGQENKSSSPYEEVSEVYFQCSRIVKSKRSITLCIDRSIAFNPQNVKANFRKGILLNNESTKCIAYFKTCIENEWNHWEARWHYLKLSEKEMTREEVISHLQTILECNPDHSEARIYLNKLVFSNPD